MINESSLDSLVHKYGCFSLAGSVHQPGIKYFGDSSGVIAYAESGSFPNATWIALGDPLAPLSSWEELIRKFTIQVSDTAFLNIGQQAASILQKENFTINDFGWEGIIQLDEYTLDGPKKQNIRNAVRRIEKLGYKVDELSTDENWNEISQVSQNWLRFRSSRRPENRLVTRPLMKRGRFQRLFGLWSPDGLLVHLVSFDEIWQEGSIIGYHSNINRSTDQSPKNADYAIHCHVMDVLRSEGISMLSLGLCPDFLDRSEGLEQNRYLSLTLSFAQRFGANIYNFGGIAEHKAEFRPTYKRRVFLAIQKPWPVSTVLAGLRFSSLM
jgi:hypothetical protein